MRVPFGDLYAQYLSIQGELDAAIADVIRESAFIRGRHVEAFEASFASKMGVKHCISCGNGTDALYVAMRALGVERGDEVITTAHSWISTSETITQAGGRVVFCDTEDGCFTIDPANIEAKIGSRTVGIIPVHLYGQAANMEAIMRLARQHGLWVLEDCAQAHFASFGGQLVGTFGSAATFSFYPGKNLGAMGDAGAIVTNDDSLASYMTMYARHGGLRKGEHLIEGINSRLDGLQAGILQVKLAHIANWTESRRRLAGLYNAMLSGVGDIRCPEVAQGRDHVYHLYVIRTKCRDKLRAFLRARGIETNINYPVALPFLEAYSYLAHSPSEFPVAFRHQREILSLPIYPEMKQEAVSYVCESIRAFFSGGGEAVN